MTGVLLAFVALAMFSANVIITRVASARLSLNQGYLVAVSVNIAFAALLFAIDLAVRRAPPHWSGMGVLLFALAGLFATYLGRWFVLEAIAVLGPAKASAFQVSSPLFTFAIALVFLGERLSAVAVAGMVLTALGLLVVCLPGSRTTGRAPRPGRARSWKDWMRSGFAVGFVSSAAYAVGNVMRGAAVREWDEPIAGALIGALTGLALHFVFSSDRVNAMRGLRTARRMGIFLFAVSGVLTISAQMLVIAAMKQAPVSVVALITLCTPLFVFPASYFVLGNDEGINVHTVIGAVVTLGGIAMIILH